jgi:shikimate dehydrogenase
VNGSTKALGLIGYPVEHSYSPFIHAKIAEFYQDNVAYLPFCVENKSLRKAIQGAYALGFLGMNVTVPHKQAVMPYLKAFDPLAKCIGAVNTLVRTQDGFVGHNTDLPGLHWAMRADEVAIKDAQVILIGAGGAARTVAYLMAMQNAQCLWICNRTLHTAEALCDEVNGYMGRTFATALTYDQISTITGKKKFLGIQATNIGMSPNIANAPVEDPTFYELFHTAYDLVFNPTQTRFLQLAKESGAKTYNGLRMLLYQAILSYELWLSHSVGEDVANQIFDELKKMTNT